MIVYPVIISWVNMIQATDISWKNWHIFVQELASVWTRSLSFLGQYSVFTIIKRNQKENFLQCNIPILYIKCSHILKACDVITLNSLLNGYIKAIDSRFSVKKLWSRRCSVSINKMEWETSLAITSNNCFLG